jgi:hypothetical protein
VVESLRRAELGALARKYRALCALRARRDRAAASEAGAQPPAAAAANARRKLRTLAREFPGCLRELDVLGAEELIRRRDAAARAARGGATEPWMSWIGAYHALMRATLHVKARLAARPRAGGRRATYVGEEDARPLAEEASRIAAVEVDVTFIRAVAAPPQGRLGIVVMRRVATLFGEPAALVARALFPVRRPSPYSYD